MSTPTGRPQRRTPPKEAAHALLVDALAETSVLVADKKMAAAKVLATLAAVEALEKIAEAIVTGSRARRP